MGSAGVEDAEAETARQFKFLVAGYRLHGVNRVAETVNLLVRIADQKDALAALRQRVRHNRRQILRLVHENQVITGERGLKFAGFLADFQIKIMRAACLAGVPRRRQRPACRENAGFFMRKQVFRPLRQIAAKGACRLFQAVERRIQKIGEKIVAQNRQRLLVLPKREQQIRRAEMAERVFPAMAFVAKREGVNGLRVHVARKFAPRLFPRLPVKDEIEDALPRIGGRDKLQRGGFAGSGAGVDAHDPPLRVADGGLFFGWRHEIAIGSPALRRGDVGSFFGNGIM